MTCDEYQEQVSQYIDGELNDKNSGGLFKHLSVCGECRSFLRSTLELRSKIHDEMLMEKEGYARERPSAFTTAFALPLVALLVAFFLFLGIMQTGTQTQDRNMYPQQTMQGIYSPQVPPGNPF